MPRRTGMAFAITDHPVRVRVMGTGRYARCFLAPFAAAASLGLLTTWHDVATTARDMSLGDLTLIVAVSLAMVLPFLRSLFLGVWLDGELLVARTWFRTLKLPRSELRDCDTVTYRGFLYPEPDVGWFYDLLVSTVDGAIHRLSGTIAFRGRSRLQAYQIQAFIEGASATEALGVARARIAERKERADGGRHA